MTDKMIEVIEEIKEDYLNELYPHSWEGEEYDKRIEVLKSALSLLKEHKEGKWVRKDYEDKKIEKIVKSSLEWAVRKTRAGLFDGDQLTEQVDMVTYQIAKDYVRKDSLPNEEELGKIIWNIQSSGTNTDYIAIAQALHSRITGGKDEAITK